MASMNDTLTAASQADSAAAPSSATGATGSSSLQTTNVGDAPKPKSVTDIYTNLTQQDSPLMQQATAQANRQAARAGLLNSSMAVGSARAAQAQAAMPLAQSEAEQQTNMYQFDRGQTETERSNKAGEGLQQQSITNQNTQFGQSLAEQTRAAKAGEGLQQQSITNQNTQFGQSLAEQTRAAKAGEGMQQQQINNQASQFTQSLSQQKAESAQQNAQFNADLAQRREEARQQSDQFAQSIQANVRGSYTDAANNIINNSSVNLNNIASNANLKQADKDKLIAQELKNRNNDLQYLQSMYSGVQGWADRL